MTDSPTQNQGKAWLYLIVFLTGASVMVIELLGTRLIAPFYGASIYVWSSLISVTMIALAIGYFVGGRWADRAQRTGLSLIIALAALFTLLIPWATRPVLLATDSLGLRGGAFTSALVLFSPSLTLLGMVGAVCDKTGNITIGWRWQQFRHYLRSQYLRQRDRYVVAGLFPVSLGRFAANSGELGFAVIRACRYRRRV